MEDFKKLYYEIDLSKRELYDANIPEFKRVEFEIVKIDKPPVSKEELDVLYEKAVLLSIEFEKELIDELLPCPFCKCHDINVDFDEEYMGDSYSIAECIHCGARKHSYSKDVNEVIDSWNNREEFIKGEVSESV